MRKLLSIVALLATLFSTSGIARAQPTVTPDPQGAEGLLVDLERIVSVEETVGWFVDRVALQSLHPTLMQSVCRASEGARVGALIRIEDDARAAGDPPLLFARAGNSIDAATRRALHVHRQATALRNAMAAAPADCPFWAAPALGFKGRQTDRDRFTLSIETGGMIQVRQTQGDWTYGGGGVIRLLPGYGFGGRVTLLGGLEFGGGAMLKSGGGPTEFVVNYFPALPVVLRIHDGMWHYDLETAAVTLVQADDHRTSYGVRAGAGIGVSALRTRSFLPWAGIAIAYEHDFEGVRPRADFFRAGLRVGAMWDPF